MSREAVNFFQDQPLFREFSPEQVAHIASFLAERHLKKGKLLFKEGDPGDALHFIADGQVRILKTIDANKGSMKSLAVLGRGSFLGEMALLEGTARSATALVGDSATIYSLSKEDFDKLLAEDPILAIRFVSAFFSATNERRKRTATELITLYEMGLALGRNIPLEEVPHYFLQLVTEALEINRGLLILHNTLSDRYQVEHYLGAFPQEVEGIPFLKRHPLLEFLTTQKQGVVFTDYFKTRFFKKHINSGFEEDSMMISPLLVGGRFIGAVAVYPKNRNHFFDTSSLNLLMGVSSMAAGAIEQANLIQSRQAKKRLSQKRFRI